MPAGRDRLSIKEEAKNSGGRSSVHGSARALRTVASGCLLAGSALVVALAVHADDDAKRAFAEAEATGAALLWELTDGEIAIDELLPGRASIRRFNGGRTPTPAIPDSPQAATAFGYRKGELEPAALVTVSPAQRGGAIPVTAAAAGALGTLLMAAWTLRRKGSAPRLRYPVAILGLAGGVLLTVTFAARQWTLDELTGLSAERLHLARHVAEISYRYGASTEESARAAGLPWATDAGLADPTGLWTMPRSVGAAVAESVGRSEDPSGVQVDGAAYRTIAVVLRSAARPTTTVHMVFLGYEETAPLGRTVVAACATGVALALTLFLLPICNRPRVLRRTVVSWSFLAPAAALLLVFTVGPLLWSLWISMREWHPADTARPFVGFAHFRGLVVDRGWWEAVRNTAVFTLHVPVAMAVALTLALLARGSGFAARWARLAFFLPGITSVAAIAVVWKWVLNDGHGLANRLLATVGVGPVAWLTSPSAALASLMMIGVWMIVGYQMVVFQAGLAAIPRVWYDAARVDGAGPLQRFRHITLPGLRHTLFFVLVTSVIGSFQVFSLVYVMTEGGPLGATDVAVYHIYREAWEFLRFGNAAAMSWMLFAVIFAATWLHFRFLESSGARA